MQTQAKKSDAVEDARRIEEQAINDRLVEGLRANAIKAEQTTTLPVSRAETGFFREVWSFFGLIGLIVATYVYSLLIDSQA